MELIWKDTNQTNANENENDVISVLMDFFVASSSYHLLVKETQGTYVKQIHCEVSTPKEKG